MYLVRYKHNDTQNLLRRTPAGDRVLRNTRESLAGLRSRIWQIHRNDLPDAMLLTAAFGFSILPEGFADRSNGFLRRDKRYSLIKGNGDGNLSTGEAGPSGD